MLPGILLYETYGTEYARREFAFNCYMQLSGRYWDGSAWVTMLPGNTYNVVKGNTCETKVYFFTYFPQEGYVPIVGKLIDLYKNNIKNGSSLTDQYGFAYFPNFTPDLGETITIQAKFPGDSTYNSASTGIITVKGVATPTPPTPTPPTLFGVPVQYIAIAVGVLAVGVVVTVATRKKG